MNQPTEFAKGFQPSLIQVIGDIKGRHGMDQLWAFKGVFNGREYFNIRQVYKDETGAWAPGKQGMSMPWDPAVVNALMKGFGLIQIA